MWKTVCVAWCGLNLALSVFKVEGIAMGIAPNNIIFSTTRVGNQALTTAFTCGSISATDIKRVNSLKMYRLSRKEGSGIKLPIVSVYPNEAPEIEAQDLVTAGATVEGSVVSNREQNNFQAFVTLSIPTVKLICQDGGQYTCELNYENRAGVVVDPMQDSVNFTGYALADQVSLIGRPDAFNTGDGSETYPFQMKEGDVIEFTCSGRIGGDATTQWEWKKTGDTGNLIPLNPSLTMYQDRINETKGPAVPVENECTNTRATKLRYTISSNDKNVAKAVKFQCYIDSQNSNISSPFVYVLVAGATNNNGGGTGGSTDPEVEGVRLTIAPENSVTLYKVPTSIAQQSRTFTCRAIQANPADIKIGARLSITRMTKREVNSGATEVATIAIVLDGDLGLERPNVVDIQDRNRVPDDGIAGKIDKLDYRQSFLSIKFNTVAMKCDDAGQYFCNLVYLDTSFNTKSEMDSMNLTVSAIPDRVSLIGQPEPRRNGDGSENYPFQMKTDDVIEFTCSGRIGGDQNTQWEWKKTGESGSLIKLVPSSMMYQNRVNETRGPAVPVDAECTNTRTTTLRYTISDNDKSTKVDKIQFQCYTESQGANVSSRFVYIQVEDVVGPTSTDGGSVPVVCTCKDCDADQKAAIVGGCMSIVIACLSAALVYVLIRQQKCLQTKGNPTYETPQRLGDATLTYDTLQQPGDSYEVPEQRNPHTYTNTNI